MTRDFADDCPQQPTDTSLRFALEPDVYLPYEIHNLGDADVDLIRYDLRTKKRATKTEPDAAKRLLAHWKQSANH